MYTILIISIIIVIVILVLSLLTTSKAYEYKHTVDSIKDNPYLKEDRSDQTDQAKEKKIE
jgi:FtsZ-interacting cell division protein ZipA